MRELTIGKTRGLQQLSNSRGVFTICAADHRRALRKMMNTNNPSEVTYQAMMDFKMDVCEILAPAAGSVLLDPIYSASQAIASNKISGQTGLLISLDAAAYDSYVEESQPDEFLIDWNPDKVRSMGASAVKIPLYYRPDLPSIASKQLETLNKIAYNCREADIALCVGPRNYIVPELERDQWEWAGKKPDLVIDTARQLSMLPIDLLEVEFPVDVTYEHDEEKMYHLCRHLNEACKVPWVLLSGGVNFDVFRKQLKIACKAGASGFIAGRALWQDAASTFSRRERVRCLQGVSTDRLNELMEIADKYAAPWHEKLKSTNNYILPDFTADWYRNYQKFNQQPDREKLNSSVNS